MKKQDLLVLEPEGNWNNFLTSRHDDVIKWKRKGGIVIARRKIDLAYVYYYKELIPPKDVLYIGNEILTGLKRLKFSIRRPHVYFCGELKPI